MMSSSESTRGYWVIRRRDGCYLSRGVTGIDLWSPDPRFALAWCDRREAIKAARAHVKEYPEVVIKPGALKATAARHASDGDD